MQLTHDIADIEQDDQEDYRPFQQADEATLPARKIRSLPRHRGLGGQSSGQRTSSSQSPVPSGFGLEQIAPSSMTESLASISTTAPATTVTPFTFSKPNSVGLVPNFSFKLPSPAPVPRTLSMTSQPPAPPSSNPIHGHKPRTSFNQPSASSPLNNEITASPSGTPPFIFTSPLTSDMPTSDAKLKPTFPTSGSNTAMNVMPSVLSEICTSQDEVNYWKGLYGLNISFLAMARSLFEGDVVSDLSELFAGYCKSRDELGERRRTVQAVSGLLKSTVTVGGPSFAGRSVSLGSLVPPTSTTTLTTGTGGFQELTTGFSFGGKTVSFTSDSGSSAAATTARSSQSTSIDIDELKNDKGGEKEDEGVKKEESQQPSVSKFGVTTKGMNDGGSGFSFGALPGAKPISSFRGFGASSGTSDFKFGFGATQSTTTGATKQPFSVGLPAPGTTKPPEKNQEPSVSIASKPVFSFGLPPPSSTTPPTSGPGPSFSLGLPPGVINAPMSTSSPVPNEKRLTGGGGISTGHLPGSLPTKSSYPSTSSAAVEAAVQATNDLAELRKILLDLGKKLDLQGRKTQSQPGGKKSKGKKGKKANSAPTGKQKAGKVNAPQQPTKPKTAGKVNAPQQPTKPKKAGGPSPKDKAKDNKKNGGKK